jgi:hypothetical protein
MRVIEYVDVCVGGHFSSARPFFHDLTFNSRIIKYLHQTKTKTLIEKYRIGFCET